MIFSSQSSTIPDPFYPIYLTPPSSPPHFLPTLPGCLFLGPLQYARQWIVLISQMLTLIFYSLLLTLLKVKIRSVFLP